MMKRQLRRIVFSVFAVFLLSAADTHPAVWSDHATGLAIAGFDPMSYVTHDRPVRGEENLEFRWGGTTWRFANEGNRAAFKAHPKIYAPHFAGYDIVSLSQGRLVRGLPTIWIRLEEQLYLFSSLKNLKSCNKKCEDTLKKASDKWKKLSFQREDFKFQ